MLLRAVTRGTWIRGRRDRPPSQISGATRVCTMRQFTGCRVVPPSNEKSCSIGWAERVDELVVLDTPGAEEEIEVGGRHARSVAAPSDMSRPPT